jgi:hypothetical protein
VASKKRKGAAKPAPEPLDEETERKIAQVIEALKELHGPPPARQTPVGRRRKRKMRPA